MRRKNSEVKDPAQIEDVLETVNIGRLATMGSDGYPYITPVNFVYLGGHVYFHCAPQGEKLDNIARDPKVCFQVEQPLAYLDSGYTGGKNIGNLHQFYKCVVIRGEARVVPDGPLKSAALNALVAKHEKRNDVEEVREDMPAYKACKVVEIKPGGMTAKFDLAQNRSPEERLAIAEYLKERNRPRDRDTIEAMGFDPDDI
jgi:nitroimidazol reductase NimA-like FMN-containing flavoprotein (pyridoxamine 5'-phosphate oxidase superfamily)